MDVIQELFDLKEKIDNTARGDTFLGSVLNHGDKEEEDEEEEDATETEKQDAEHADDKSIDKRDKISKKRKHSQTLTKAPRLPVTLKRFEEELSSPMLRFDEETPVVEWGTTFDEKDEFSLNVIYPDVTWSGKLTQLPTEVAKQLWDLAPRSGYGDNKTGTTNFDIKVRNARELTMEHVTLDERICRRVEHLWAAHKLFPKHVRAEPYKINIYGPGGMFAQHLDTPSTHLIGTFVVGLHNTTQKLSSASWRDREPTLDVGSKGHLLHQWRGDANSYIAFYTDVPHEVQVIPSGYRVTLTFKIFHDQGSSRQEEVAAEKAALFSSVIKNLSRWRRPYGFLLSHKYTIQDDVSDLKAYDQVLYNVLRKLPQDEVQIYHVPVSLRHKEKHIYEGSSFSKERVYLISLRSMLKLLRGEKPLTTKEEAECLVQNQQAKVLRRLPRSIPFFQWSNKYLHSFGLEWEKDEETAGFTGNEAQDGRVDATYICSALIVVSK